MYVYITRDTCIFEKKKKVKEKNKIVKIKEPQEKNSC